MADNFRRSPKDEETRKFDPFVHATTIISEEHRMIHDGFLFYRTYLEADIPDGASRTVLFRTGPNPPHFKRLTITASEGPVLVDIAEDAVVNVLGTPLVSYNANRVSEILPQAQFYASDTTFTNVGNPIIGNLYIPAQGNNGVAGETGAIEELILKPNADYSLTFTNDPAGSGTADVNIVFVWYEVGYET